MNDREIQEKEHSLPAEEIKVCPPELLASADAAARALEKAAAPVVDGVPRSFGAASAADLAGSAVVAEIGVLDETLSAASAPAGPVVETTTRHGVTMLQQQDQVNAAAMRTVGRQASNR